VSELTSPLTFQPIFKERIWGGRKLATLFGKTLPEGVRIGESWELVDRGDDQSVVKDGPLIGQTLHELWINHRAEIFGEVAGAPRFPLLIKLLDCAEKLSLQVHPPESAAQRLGGEPKTECWYIAAAEPDSELYLGVRKGTDRRNFADAIRAGKAADHTNRVPVDPGDFFFIQSGHLHAIGGGNVIVEIQQNSDTTYRVFDWNRIDENGQSRDLHVEESLACIDFNHTEPKKADAAGEELLRCDHFAVERWELSTPRAFAPRGQFAIGVVLHGEARVGESIFAPGDFFLLPADCAMRDIAPATGNAIILRTTIPPVGGSQTKSDEALPAH